MFTKKLLCLALLGVIMINYSTSQRFLQSYTYPSETTTIPNTYNPNPFPDGNFLSNLKYL